MRPNRRRSLLEDESCNQERWDREPDGNGTPNTVLQQPPKVYFNRRSLLDRFGATEAECQSNQQNRYNEHHKTDHVTKIKEHSQTGESQYFSDRDTVLMPEPIADHEKKYRNAK
jgi:hypothetical protein